jgi:hypothetical protein
VQWIYDTRTDTCRTFEINSLRLVEIAGENGNVPLMRWMVEHGPPLNLPVSATLAKECRHVEITRWLAESDRVQLVLAALFEEERGLLEHTLRRNVDGVGFTAQCSVLRRVLACGCKNAWRRVGDVAGVAFDTANTNNGEKIETVACCERL